MLRRRTDAIVLEHHEAADYAWPRRAACPCTWRSNRSFSFAPARGRPIAPPISAEHSVYSGATTAIASASGAVRLLDELAFPRAQMNTAVYEMAPDIPERLRARGDEILGHASRTPTSRAISAKIRSAR